MKLEEWNEEKHGVLREVMFPLVCALCSTEREKKKKQEREREEKEKEKEKDASNEIPKGCRMKTLGKVKRGRREKSYVTRKMWMYKKERMEFQSQDECTNEL